MRHHNVLKIKCDYRLMKLRNKVLESINNTRIFSILISQPPQKKLDDHFKKGNKQINVRTILRVTSKKQIIGD